MLTLIRKLAVQVSRRNFRSFAKSPSSSSYDDNNCIDFAKQYKKLINDNNTPLLVNHGNGYFEMLTSSVVRHGEVIPIIDTCPVSVQFPKDFLVCNPCHGLFCLYTVDGDDLALWNPATGDIKNLLTGEEGDIKTQRVVFGFDPKANDYKIVRCSVTHRLIRRVEIYSLKSKQWREISVSGEICLHLALHLSTGLFTDGVFYWRCTRSYPEKWISIDIASEQFNVQHIERAYYNWKLDTFNGRLAVVFLMGGSDDPEYLEIWVRRPGEGHLLVWSCQNRSGPFSFRGNTSQCFWKNEGLILLTSTYQLLWYDLNTNEMHKSRLNLRRSQNQTSSNGEKPKIQVLNFPEILVSNPW